MTQEKVLTEAVLVFLCTKNKVLLAKKMKKIGAGKWNGYGGGIEKGETALEAAVRELYEETGEGVQVDPSNLSLRAVVSFHNTMSSGELFTCRVRMYTAAVWTGDVHDTAEMTQSTWFPIDALPIEEMMPADTDWLPRMLQGETFVADAWLGAWQQEKLATTEVRQVTSFDEE